MGVEEAAFDCWRVVNANMTQAVRRWTAGKGVDPRDLAMLAYGGNGPLFAAIQAQEFGIRRVWVPKASPAFSALGALAALPTVDAERAYLRTASQAEAAELGRLWHQLDERAERYLGAAGFAREFVSARYLVNLRYPGQNWSLVVEAATVRGGRDFSFVGPGLLAEVVERFHRRHEEEYGHRRAAEEPELTGAPHRDGGGGGTALRRRAECNAPRAEPGAHAPCEPGPRLRAHRDPPRPHTPPGRHCARTRGDRGDLTIAAYPGWEALVDDAGDYLLTRTE